MKISSTTNIWVNYVVLITGEFDLLIVILSLLLLVCAVGQTLRGQTQVLALSARGGEVEDQDHDSDSDPGHVELAPGQVNLPPGEVEEVDREGEEEDGEREEDPEQDPVTELHRTAPEGPADVKTLF